MNHSLLSSEEHKLFTFKGKRIWVTGHLGMLGSALVRRLSKEGAELLVASSKELDLRDQSAVIDWVNKNRPELVFHAGAKVGGIHANTIFRADFLHDNLMIQTNVINAAHKFGVRKLLFVASNCTYPTKADQPISEDALLTGPLEDNIRSYAIAKINNTGVILFQLYRLIYMDLVIIITLNMVMLLLVSLGGHMKQKFQELMS
jgi:GDP-L-fucose synthase